MSRSKLPQTDADRIAVAATMIAIAAIVWLILAVVLSPRDVSIATAHGATMRHVDEGNRAASPAPSDYFPPQFKAPDGAAAERSRRLDHDPLR